MTTQASPPNKMAIEKQEADDLLSAVVENLGPAFRATLSQRLKDAAARMEAARARRGGA